MSADVRFEVDWCAELKFDSNGDHNMDGERRTVEDFPTFAEAIDRAKSLIRDGLDVYGAVSVTREERNPNYPHKTGQQWDQTGTCEVSDADAIYAEEDLQ